MHARAVEDAAKRLHELRSEEWGDTILAAAALGAAVAASRFAPSISLALLAGGCVMTFLTMRAMVRRWSLLDYLKAERDAYTIPEVRLEAEKAANKQSRRHLARAIRLLLEDTTYAERDRVEACADELALLAEHLEDRRLDLDPACAVACARLITDAAVSPLFNPGLPAEDALATVLRVDDGFVARDRADAAR